MKSAYTLIFLIALSCAATVTAQVPTQERHPGVVLFEQAKYREAIKTLEKATKSTDKKLDAELWNYLGLSYMANDDPKKARKAFEKSVGLSPTNAVFQANLAYSLLANAQTEKALSVAEKAIAIDSKNATAYQVRSIANLWSYKFDSAEADADRFIELSPTNVDAYLTKSEVILAKLNVKLVAGKTIKDEVSYLKRAVDALQAGVAACSKSRELPRLQSELKTLSIFYAHYTRDKAPVSTPEVGAKPLRIIYKPQARYTDRARSANIEGGVLLAALFEADGTITHVFLLKRLGFGLDQAAIEAVKKIKFEPKHKDGKPVPSVVTIEYSFSIY